MKRTKLLYYPPVLSFTRLLTALLCLLSYSLTHCLYAASWPLFRSGAQRTGAAGEIAEPGLVPKWNYQIQGGIISSPVVYKGIVYCGGRDGSVWAWDAATGEVVWQYSTSGWVDATPCVSSTTVFVPSRDKNIYAFDRLTGEIIWQTYTGSADCSSPVLSDGKLYFLSGHPEKKVYRIDALSGEITGSFPVSQMSFSSPAVKDNLLFFGTNDGKFHCLDLKTGQIQWSRPTEGGIFYSTLAAGEDALYAVSGGDERRLFCLNPASGETIWQSEEMGNQTSVVSSVGLGENAVIVASGGGGELNLYAFPLSGASPVEKLWSTGIGVPTPLGILSSPAVANGVVYVGSGDGRLYCIDASNGKYVEPASGNLSDTATGYYLCTPASHSGGIASSPAIANGWVYAGTCDGNFWALEALKAAAISSPDNDELIISSAEIRGIVTWPSLSSYRLECGAGSSPASWTEIATSSGEPASGTLAFWNASGLKDGLYSVRLTLNDDVSRKAVNRVLVNNPPPPPANVNVADTPFDEGGSLTLSWDRSPDDGANNNDVTGYTVYKSTSDGDYASLAQLSRGATSYIDTRCPVYTTYYYRLSASDALSESAYTDAVPGFSLMDGVEVSPESGGTVRLDLNGLVTEVVIDPGSVSEKVWVGIKIPPEYPDTGIGASAQATRVVREFGITPPGTAFLKPVTIKIPYQPQDVANMNRDNLRIYWWDTYKNEWRIVNTSDPLSENGRVWARIPHFSLYRIMEYVPGREELLSADKVYTYPNPARGDKLYFKYYLGDKADVTVDVYNVAGELIVHLERADNPAGIVSELEWDMANVASGAYVYRLEARSGSATKSVKKKLAIIH